MIVNSYIETIAANLDSIPIRAGQQIFCKDSRDLYIDNSDTDRTHLSDIIKLNTDAERSSLLAPIPNKLYLIIETKLLWMSVGGAWFVLNELSVKQDKIDNRLMTTNKDMVEAVNELFKLIPATAFSLSSYTHSSTITTPVTEMAIGIPEYRKNKDFLFIYVNGIFVDSSEYTMDEAGTKLTSITENRFNGSIEQPFAYTFVILKGNLTIL